MTHRTKIATHLFACALMLIAFAPHHHADARDPGHCAACVSMHNSLHSLPTAAPVFTANPVVVAPAPMFLGIVASVDAARTSDPRAPPF